MSEFDNYKAIQTTLEKYTPREYVKTKVDQTDGTVIEYIEAWKVIELANNIFGEGGWSNFVRELKIIDNEYENGMFHVTSTCIVKIQLKTGTTHEEMGIGLAVNKDKSLAYQNSKKDAVSDGIKRCLRLFGNVLGNKFEDDPKKPIKKNASDSTKTTKATSTTIPSGTVNQNKPPTKRVRIVLRK